MRRAHLAIAGIVISVALGSAVFFGGGVQIEAASFRALPEREAEEELLRMSGSEGPENTWQFLKDALMPDGSLIPSANDPHELAHVLGKDIYRRLGEKGIEVCDQSFTYGCYHGFVRALYEEMPESPTTALVCEKAPNYGGCLHGFGHALGSMGGDLEKALRTCDVLFEKFTFGCWEGVFMEFVKTFAPPKGSDLWQVCDSVAGKYREQCAKSLPGRMSDATSAAVAEFCLKGATLALQSACADAFGADAVHRSHGVAEKIEEACSLFEQRLQFYCYSSAARLVIQRAQHDGLEVAHRLCGNVPGRIEDCRQEIKNAQDSLR
jgi:hypothetical protein